MNNKNEWKWNKLWKKRKYALNLQSYKKNKKINPGMAQEKSFKSAWHTVSP